LSPRIYTGQTPWWWGFSSKRRKFRNKKRRIENLKSSSLGCDVTRVQEDTSSRNLRHGKLLKRETGEIVAVTDQTGHESPETEEPC